MDKSFIELGLNENIVKALNKINIDKPTDIQEKTIPVILESKDVIFQSPTGTGKTFSYLLPLFQNLKQKPEVQVLIISPTHELSSQIKGQVELLVKNSEIPLTFALMIGDVNIQRQIDKLKTKPNIIVGSAGRILELIEKKKIKTQTINTFIIDEADRMLDLKNVAQVKSIIKFLPKERQTILVSASIHNSDVELAKTFMNNPELILVEKNTVPSNIKHSYFIVDEKNKIEVLRKLINFLKPKKSLVFVQQSDIIGKLLDTKYHGLKVGSLFGFQEKEERKKVIDDFKKGKLQILLATDIAARGLDIEGVSHVFNFDLAKDFESYQHRAGRTGRQNAEGHAISLVTTNEKVLLSKIAKGLKIEIEQILKI